MGPSDADFRRFVTLRRKKLQQIAYRTRGECQLGDVENEAWQLAAEWGDLTGRPIDLNEPAQQDRLIAFLYQRLVRYTEVKLRGAIRLDHAPDGTNWPDGIHPVLAKMSANEGQDPLTILMQREDDTQAARSEPDCHHSIASAFMHLLRHFDNQMPEVARHLLISPSWAYARCARSRLQAHCQESLCCASGGAFLPGPWRLFKLTMRPETYPEPVQLVFGFGFASGAPVDSWPPRGQLGLFG